MSTIRKTFRIDGVLTDMTSVKLSSADGTYGVKRTDNGAVVVADGTAMTKLSTGVYAHTFADPADGLTYAYVLEVVHGGETIHTAGEFDGPTGDEDSEEILEDTLLENAWSMRPARHTEQASFKRMAFSHDSDLLGKVADVGSVWWCPQTLSDALRYPWLRRGHPNPPRTPFSRPKAATDLPGTFSDL